MKTTIIIMALMASSLIATAQKGSWYIGGLVGYSSSSFTDTNDNKDATTNWALAPEGGTFLKDDIQLGLALGIVGSTTTVNDSKTDGSTSINPTAYVRKFFKVTDVFSTFGGVYLNYTSNTQTDYSVAPSVESSQSGVGIRLGVGVAFALSPRFTALGQYGLMGYQSLNRTVGGNDAGSTSSFDFGVNTVGSGTLSQGNGSGAVFNVGIYYTFKTQ